jgi:hypothetical protein
MKRTLILVVLVAVGVLVVDQLGDATQTRDDERSSARQTQVVIHIEGKHYRQSLDTAAQALYASCTATVGGDLVGPGLEKVGDGEYRFAMTPSLGDHGKERLLGCLNDLSIDRIKSNVESVKELPLRVAA